MDDVRCPAVPSHAPSAQLDATGDALTRAGRRECLAWMYDPMGRISLHPNLGGGNSNAF